MSKLKPFLVYVDEKQYKVLRVKLDGLPVSVWVRKQIDTYLKKDR